MVLLAGGCIKKPVVSLHDVSVENFSFTQVDLVFELKVFNPNAFQLSLSRLSCALASDGTEFARASVPGPVAAVAGGETTVVQAPVTIRFAPLVEVLTRRPRDESIPYELTAEAGFSAFGVPVIVPFRRAGWMPVLRKPDWHFREVRLVREGAIPSRVELVFNVDNPNSFAIPLDRLSGELTYGEDVILRISQPRMDPPAARPGATCLVVPIRLDAPGIVAAVVKAFAGGQREKFQFKGRLDLGAPELIRTMLLEKREP